MTRNRLGIKKKKTGWKFLLFLLIFLFTSAFTAAVVINNSIKEFDVGSLQQLLRDTPKDKARETVKIFDARNNLIDEFDSGENRDYVPLSSIKKITQQAFISAEDERFYYHKGFDLRSILRAFARNIFTGDMGEGGSTITQQLARNVYLNSFEKTISRKIKELLLATEIEKKYSKKEILEFYLNQVYFGSGAYGIEAASKRYFGKSASKLDLAESAMLAGVLTSPAMINPHADWDKTKEAQRSVLTKMVNNGYIKHWQFEQAQDEKIKIASVATKSNVSSINYFIDFAKEELASKVGQDQLLKGGLNVYTTVDPSIQTAAEQAMNVVLDRAEKNGDFGKVALDKFGAKQPQGALVALDVKTGWVRAMVGGRDYKTTQYNRTLALRAPGSTFKTIVYSAAFEKGILSPYSPIRSSPISIGDWNPTEWFRGYFGTVSVQYAIQESSNICAIRALMYTGTDVVADYAKKMAGIGEISFLGDRKILAVPSMALGTVEMRPIEMASTGQTIANMGVHLPPVSILKIVNRKNNSVIYNASINNTEASSPISATTAYDMITCLKRVVKYGTGTKANVLGVPCAGKTGTTTNFRDGWFLGFTPRISAAVYVGADSSDTDLSFVQNYGSTYSAVIWKEFISRLPKDGIKDWEDPSGGKWVYVKVCEETGLRCNDTCNGVIRQFRPDKVPTAICPKHHTQFVDVTICTDTGKIANDACPHTKIVRFERDKVPKEYCQLHLKKQTDTKKPDDKATKKPDTKKSDQNNTSQQDNSGNQSNKDQNSDKPPDNQTKPKPDPQTKPDPKPDPKPNPNPKPDPKPNPEPKPDPEPEPEPEPEPTPETKYFVVSPSSSTSFVGQMVSFSFSQNYDSAARVEMYVNNVFVSGTGPSDSIYWKPTTATTYTILFYLKDSNGNTLDSRSIQFTVYP